MNVPLLVATVLRLFAAVWSAILIRRHGEKRIAIFTVILGVTTAISAGEVFGPGAGALHATLSILVGVLCVGAVHVIDRTLGDHADATEALRAESERRYRQIVDTSMEGIWVIDTGGRASFANKRLAEMLGYEVGEILGRHVLSFKGDDEHSDTLRRLAQIRRGNTDRVETVFLRKDGSELWARVAVNPLYDERGRYEGALGMVSDISRERRHELRRKGRSLVLEKLAAGDPLRDVLETLCVTAEETCPETLCTVLRLDESTNTLRLCAGPSAPELLMELLQNVPIGHDQASCGAAAYSKKTFIVEDVQIHPNWAAQRATARVAGFRSAWSAPILAADGSLLGTVCFLGERVAAPDEEALSFLKTTAALAGIAIERRRTEDELERTQALLLAAFEQSPAGILIADAPDGRIRIANGQALGVSSTAPVVAGVLPSTGISDGWETFHPDGSRLLPEELPLHLAVREGRRIQNMELVMRREDGLKRWVLANAGPVRDARGNITAGVAVFLDITDRKRDERDLQRLLRSLGAKTEELEGVFRTTSHDLRAPLVNIDGFGRELEMACEELRRHLGDISLSSPTAKAVSNLVEHEIPLALSYIRTSTSRMDQIMRGLTRLSHIEHCQLAVRRVDVEELVKEVARGFEFKLRERDAELDVGKLPPCTADAEQLAHVFSNLIDNAIKYLDPNRPGRVYVYGELAGDRVIYTVADNGLGVDPAHHERIFSAFHRLDPHGKVSGDGLGLTIVRRIVERHEGVVHVESRTDEGSRFVVDLPAAPVDDPVPPHSSPPAAAGRVGGARESSRPAIEAGDGS